MDLGCEPLHIKYCTLRTINACDLEDQSAEAKVDVVEAALKDGIFYLDFSNDTDLRECLSDIEELMRNLFGLNLAEKERFDIDRFDPLKLNGYKPIGRNLGGISGRCDGFESYAVAQKDLLRDQSTVLRHPEIDLRVHSLRRVVRRCLSLASIIFDALAEDWPLPAQTTLKEMHGLCPSAEKDLSMNIVRLLRYAPDAEVTTHVPQAPHTDMGSLTFLFASTPGLQIRPQGAESWQYVLPRAGMAMVNVGEALSLLSGQRFHSVLHRVASLPGRGMVERYSLAFLLRPERTAIMRSIQGFPGLEEAVTCEEWVMTKFKALRSRGDGKADSAVTVQSRRSCE
ncbi:hypothetical protein CKM354_000611600 [Cercospora kikuchii]|uniref:Fe2OG dioxygenase domain-containing protein n=1 Tax=Cercospora kikuchii TaxID=84275 RepID=A0A9P3CHJ3_9PEZI|nr:uncharacterized protein CKM354_000611600 [Cercospora kikuchii]GIZ42866.1 hypothetical protein CKM354_000611600 [Cercospora kikuchii]